MRWFPCLFLLAGLGLPAVAHDDADAEPVFGTTVVSILALQGKVYLLKRGATMSAVFSRGTHRMRVAYYQGPGYGVALVLAVSPPHAPYKIFHTDDFLPPKDPAAWVEGTIGNVDRLKHPWVPE